MGWRSDKNKQNNKGKRETRVEVVELAPDPAPDLSEIFEAEMDVPSTRAGAPSPFEPTPEPAVPAYQSGDGDEQWTSIGPSAHVSGELRGAEHVFVEGVVEGKISLPSQNLTVGPTGRIEAEVHAHSVVVEGTVVGDITAYRVEVVTGGAVEGDIRAERIVLADGSRFTGKIDMGPAPARSVSAADELSSATSPFSEDAEAADDDPFADFPDPEELQTSSFPDPEEFEASRRENGGASDDELSVLDTPNEEEPASL